MSSVPTFNTFDPFADEGDALGTSQEAGSPDYIHIRIQQRNGRKTLTTLQGLPKREFPADLTACFGADPCLKKEYDMKKILKAFKKEFACNGTLVEDEKMGQVIQLQGDQRAHIFNFLTENGLEKSTIKVHGF
ncbi:hypothetical protein H0H92_012312 [Tricholoma furcatifolium]|nr:hypothetical protein H0H92_012312 [Tricholoma furcatifolium]